MKRVIGDIFRLKKLRYIALAIVILSVLTMVVPAASVSASAASISVSPNYGPPRAAITVTGFGFTPNSAFNVKFDGVDVPWGTGTTSSIGSLYRVISVPPAVRGVHTISANTTSETASTPFTVTPAIYLSATTGNAGVPLNVFGYGFNPSTVATIYFDGAVVATMVTNAVGSFQAVFTVPQTSEGIHTILARDSSGEAPPVGYAVLSSVTFTGLGTATIDGVFSAREWEHAGRVSFPVYVPEGGTTTGTLYVMNDDTNLYLAVRVLCPSLGPLSQLAFEFDNDDDGVWPEDGDDIILVNNYGFWDDFRMSNGTAPSDSSPFEGPPGTKDGQGAFANNGQFTTFEMSHPLDSADDLHDFSLKPGDTVGFFLRLNIAWGETSQFPGNRFGHIAIAYPIIPVQVDVKPGNANSVNLKSKGSLRVAILSNNTFSASSVNATSVRLGPANAAPTRYSIEDVDHDGVLDLLLHFNTEEIGLRAGDTEVLLTGRTLDGRYMIRGSGVVKVMPSK